MTDYRYEIPELREAIDDLIIVDTHEHLPPWEKEREQETDILREYLIHYFNRDLVSAGLPANDLKTIIDPKQSLMTRWNMVEPYWNACRHTGYGRSLDIAAQGIYGLLEINTSTIEELNDLFLKTLVQKDHYRYVLKDLCRIETSLVDLWHTNVDTDFFKVSFNIGEFINPSAYDFIDSLGRQVGVSVRSFQDWLDVCEQSIENALKSNAVCLKCALAYHRSLYFPCTTFAKAEADFIVARRVNHLPDWNHNDLHIGDHFQNYMMHHILRIAEQKGVAVQFHTGLQEGNGNVLANSHPLLLTNLFLDYPQVNFDLFHMSYPYIGELGVLCKNFPNVFIDMCWGHIISPRAAMLALDEWLDAIPYNKISAFGGDYCFVDGVYGHQALARENVSKTLSRKVLAGDFQLQHAVAIAQALFVDNPKRILHLDKR